MPKIWNKYSQKRNIGASVSISAFMCLWPIYIFPRWVCLFCWRKYVDRSWEYINRSQTHECGNWGWGRAIPRKGIYKRNCRCSAIQIAQFLPDLLRPQIPGAAQQYSIYPQNRLGSRHARRRMQKCCYAWGRVRSARFCVKKWRQSAKNEGLATRQLE